MNLKTTYKTQAQIEADRANFYFASRALHAPAILHAFDFRRAVPELTYDQSQILGNAMVAILNKYREEAARSTGGGKAGELILS